MLPEHLAIQSEREVLISQTLPEQYQVFFVNNWGDNSSTFVCPNNVSIAAPLHLLRASAENFLMCLLHIHMLSPKSAQIGMRTVEAL